MKGGGTDRRGEWKCFGHDMRCSLSGARACSSSLPATLDDYTAVRQGKREEITSLVDYPVRVCRATYTRRWWWYSSMALQQWDSLFTVLFGWRVVPCNVFTSTRDSRAVYWLESMFGVRDRFWVEWICTKYSGATSHCLSLLFWRKCVFVSDAVFFFSWFMCDGCVVQIRFGAWDNGIGHTNMWFVSVSTTFTLGIPCII